eukprot:gnl/MRDRNA2_/MRDRNA2_106273_c0_seq1.p1 gnl/MRDRNA2_/MRDRNA2_106273_c0~~gnl/MRDRNA2_/MRDRNA2_106273_c0_seq1.p1  ORF type:complete len:471 (+),score=67.54 gnl/MRDRNA2_/MRDRNA2_106273_c0_seq1:68-1480(+)
MRQGQLLSPSVPNVTAVASLAQEPCQSRYPAPTHLLAGSAQLEVSARGPQNTFGCPCSNVTQGGIGHAQSASSSTTASADITVARNSKMLPTTILSVGSKPAVKIENCVSSSNRIVYQSNSSKIDTAWAKLKAVSMITASLSASSKQPTCRKSRTAELLSQIERRAVEVQELLQHGGDQAVRDNALQTRPSADTPAFTKSKTAELLGKIDNRSMEVEELLQQGQELLQQDEDLFDPGISSLATTTYRMDGEGTSQPICISRQPTGIERGCSAFSASPCSGFSASPSGMDRRTSLDLSTLFLQGDEIVEQLRKISEEHGIDLDSSRQGSIAEQEELLAKAAEYVDVMGAEIFSLTQDDGHTSDDIDTDLKPSTPRHDLNGEISQLRQEVRYLRGELLQVQNRQERVVQRFHSIGNQLNGVRRSISPTPTHSVVRSFRPMGRPVSPDPRATTWRCDNVWVQGSTITYTYTQM